MGDSSAVVLISYLGLSIFASLAVLWIAGLLMARRPASDPTHPAIAETENVFLFHESLLADHDCTQSG